MAIQEIEKSTSIGTKGHEKKIDVGAQKMIYDILQNTQYQKPEESVVRELTSNAVDSQREKEVAIDILENHKDPSEYYIYREGDKYKDSNWNPDYYDLDKFDRENNHVQLTYIEKTGVGFCDTFSIKDFGVGISGSRLEGVLSLGYSTKRNTKAALGAWGLGAKVALSLNGDYYTLITVHNGKKFIANCYSYKTDFMVGKFNTKTDQENDFITFSDGTKVYYEATEEKNYSEVLVRCKRHHRLKFRRAIESQLLYFPNVKLNIIYEDGKQADIPFLANVLYNSSNIIISDNTQFSKPHVVIVKGDDSGEAGVGVCYGYIEFTELEMEDLSGNIGVKCPIRSVIRDEATGEETVLQEGVSVTPSREAVIWDDHTRAFLKERFNEVVEEANDLVTEQLQQDDFLAWLGKCRVMISKMDNSSVLGRMSRVIDTHKLKPRFKLEKSLRYTDINTMFWGFKIRLVQSSFNSKKNSKSISRTEVESWGPFDYSRVFFKKDRTKVAKDAYLTDEGGDFIMLELADKSDLEESMEELSKEHKAALQKSFDRRDLVLKWVLKSEYVTNYDEIEIPEDYSKQYDNYDDESGDVLQISPKERRRLEQRIVVTTPTFNGHSTWESPNITFKKHEPKIEDLVESDLNVYYGVNSDRETLEEVARLMKSYGRHGNYGGNKFYEDESSHFKLLKVSTTNVQYVKQFEHVDRFFTKLTHHNLITMADELVKWHTARIINENLVYLKFFANFDVFHQEYANYYLELKKYGNQWGTSVSLGAHRQQYFDKVLEMQLFVRENQNDAEAIRNKSKELFIIDEVEDGLGVDLELYDKLHLLLEYAEPVHPLFNSISFLTNTSKHSITSDQQVLIREILQRKNLPTV